VSGRSYTPRLLVVCLTDFKGYSATSRIKEVFFGGWPDEKLRHVHVNEGTRTFSDREGNLAVSDSGQDEVLRAVIEYRPEVIYYRAVDHRLIHDFVLQLAQRNIAPFVIHLMDDWPARLERSHPLEFPHFDQTLRKILASASYRLSIGKEMANAFKERYGLEFVPFANAVDPSSTPARRKRKWFSRNAFVVRYAGALADDMTFESVMDVAKAIEDLSSELNVRMEIYTRPPWQEGAESCLRGAKAVSVRQQVPSKDYKALLEQADTLLIAYNFDEASRNYVKYSMANKLPEYMISGRPILAYGPGDIATIKHLAENDCAYVVDRHDPILLRNGIRALVNSRSLQRRLCETASKVVAVQHDVGKIREALHALLVDTAKAPKREPELTRSDPT
jgi:glycosyltransferase involved in cell wall biosynthesis